MADEPIQPIDINSDENADWIKLVHDGKGQKEDAVIHAELAKKDKDAEIINQGPRRPTAQAQNA